MGIGENEWYWENNKLAHIYIWEIIIAAKFSLKEIVIPGWECDRNIMEVK